MTDELPPALRAELNRKWNAHLGVAHIGVALDIVSRTELRAVVDPVQPHHRGGMGTAAVNGPTIAGIFDLVTGLTGYIQALGQKVGVAQLNIQFMRPVLGDRFEVIGRPVKSGKSLVFVACELLDETGTMCARADGLVSVSEAEGTNELAL
ncbi:MAG: PaaI family thioesterase [Candidatus Palauibacterales bacterium]|nr:PaaI family thioesterase [Candidatus Palauibacterales bacterium]